MIMQCAELWGNRLYRGTEDVQIVLYSVWSGKSPKGIPENCVYNSRSVDGRLTIYRKDL